MYNVFSSYDDVIKRKLKFKAFRCHSRNFTWGRGTKALSSPSPISRPLALARASCFTFPKCIKVLSYFLPPLKLFCYDDLPNRIPFDDVERNIS